jgi:hypothetical protein
MVASEVRQLSITELFINQVQFMARIRMMEFAQHVQLRQDSVHSAALVGGHQWESLVNQVKLV